MGRLVSMLLVQVVQGVQGVDDLHMRDPGSPEPLEEVDLLDGETRLLALLEHPGRGRNRPQRKMTTLKKKNDSLKGIFYILTSFPSDSTNDIDGQLVEVTQQRGAAQHPQGQRSPVQVMHTKPICCD